MEINTSIDNHLRCPLVVLKTGNAFSINQTVADSRP